MKLAFSKELTIFTITIVFNFFSPTFGQWEKYIIDNTLNKPEVVAIGDLNGDTKLDVVVNDLSDNKIICYENNYPNWIKHNIDSNLEGAYVPDIGDLDGDGDLDVVASGYRGNVVVWYENNYPEWNKHIIAENLKVSGAVSIADIDGDDTLDVVSSGYRQGGDVVWYENNHPSWPKHTIRSDYATEWSWVGDVDGDGAIDVAVARWYENEVNWFRNENAGLSWTEFVIDDSLGHAGHLSFGDIDRDNDMDIAVAGESDDVVVWYENNHPAWEKHIIDANLYRSWTVVVVDIDNDEKPDVAAVSKDADIVVWYKNNHPEWEKHIIDPNLDGALLLLSADIDNDNAPDIVVPGSSAGNLVWYKNPTDMVWSKSTEINSNYIKPNSDTFILNSSMVNPENHQASVFARLKSETGSIKDSIQLFDDGLHNDAEASDNLWSGSSLLSGFEEGMFRMDLFINDLTTGTSYVHPEVSLFTTAGPIEFGSTDIDTLSDGRIALKNFVLVNRGIEMTVENIEAELTTLDTDIELSLSSKYFGDILAGESKTIPAAFAFFAPEDNQLIKFEIKIRSNGKEYWSDSLIIDIANLTDIDNDPTVIPKEFSLEQNYPNPFNPSTTIKYSIPSSSVISNPQGGERSPYTNSEISPFSRNDNVHVWLKVYDILGREVATLVNEKQRPGNYEVKFDASTSLSADKAGSATGKELTSGIYFYQLQTGKYLETKKMLMIK